jgi:hypothetical protein
VTRRVRSRRLPALAVGTVLAFSWLGIGVGVAHADAVPYRDHSAAGDITLCDRSGQPVTSGTLAAQPFAWRAVGSQAAPAPYDAADSVASLYVYLPRKGFSPQTWVGVPLTAVTEYTDVNHPMAQATILDPPLKQFSDQIALKNWDGHLQLRLMYSSPGMPTNTTTYAAADVRIDGQTWTLLGGGSSSCGSTTDAKSKETYLSTYDKLVKQAERKQAAQSATSPTATPAPTSSGAGTGESGTGGVASPQAAGSTGHPAGGSNPVPLLGGLGVALVVAIGGFWWWRLGRR